MESSLPHESAFTRLGRSEIEGIGVFAIRHIPRGTNIFPNDRLGIRWIDKTLVDRMADDTVRKLYEEFAIRKGELLGCPANFNSMTVGWYLNEPANGDEPNVVVDGDYAFHAARDIAAGEELTARYADFSDH